MRARMNKRQRGRREAGLDARGSRDGQGGRIAADAWRRFSGNTAGAPVQARAPRIPRSEVGRAVRGTWALEAADSAPETWAPFALPPCECGQATQAPERCFPPLRNSTDHIFLTGRACSLDVQYLGDLVHFGSCFENLFSYTISASQEA